MLIFRTTRKIWSILSLRSYNLVILSTESQRFRESNRIFTEALHISENKIQIQASKRSETFGKIPLTCPSDVLRFLCPTCNVTSSKELPRPKSVQGKLYQTPVIKLE